MKTLTQPDRCRYIISDVRKGSGRTFYVAAPPGYYRKADGTLARDGTPFTSGPEWTEKRGHAREFTSYLSAARVRSKCASAVVHPIA